MNVRRTRSLLWLAAVFLLIGSAFVAWRGLTLPLEAAPSASPSQVPATEGLSLAGDGAPPLKAFEPIWALDLRRPLYDPVKPAPQPPAPPPPPPPLNVRLVGTMVEPAREPGGKPSAQALISAGRSSMEIKQVGDKVGDAGREATIVAIDANSVTVLYHGKEQVLRIEESQGN